MDVEEEHWDRPGDRSVRLYDRAFDQHDSADYQTSCYSIAVYLKEQNTLMKKVQEEEIKYLNNKDKRLV